MLLDLNCDLGEGCPLDADLMPWITSANVACGGHAGDEATMTHVLLLARQHGVQVGAHPGFPDREHFGRREVQQDSTTTQQQVLAQIETLLRLADPLGVPVRYLKPHGALYNQACRDETVAAPLVAAAVVHRLPVVGLPGSRLEAVCAGRVPFVPEGFADRRYRPDGTLVPRDQPGAVLDDPVEAVAQAATLLQAGRIRTLCVHGDNPHALAFLRSLRDSLSARGILLQAFTAS